MAALARVGSAGGAGDDVRAELESLLTKVKGDDEARQRYVDLLEVLGADDPDTASFRKRLTARCSRHLAARFPRRCRRGSLGSLVTSPVRQSSRFVRE